MRGIGWHGGCVGAQPTPKRSALWLMLVFLALRPASCKLLRAICEAWPRGYAAQAVDRLVQNATVMGANAVLLMRFDSSEIGQTMSEIVPAAARGRARGRKTL